jgi:hypothetical protein
MKTIFNLPVWTCCIGRAGKKIIRKIAKMMNVSLEKIRWLIESISYNKDKFS